MAMVFTNPFITEENRMPKRLIVVAALVISLLSVLLIVGSVLAQSPDSANSADSGPLRPIVPVATESAPAAGHQSGSTDEHPASSAAGPAVAAGAPVVEREPGAANRSSTAPNAPTYNSTIRFVGSTLRPRQNNVSYTTNGNGSCVYVTAGSANTVWNLPLALPEGSKVEWLRMYYHDTDGLHNTSGWFTKYDLYGGLVQEWAVDSTGSGGNAYADVLISPTETIDYSVYSYVLNWRPVAVTSTLQLCGFRLFYTAPVGGIYLPIVIHH
jgi:hypothetical protein